MQIGSPRLNTYSVQPESANVVQRQKRSIDPNPPKEQELVKEVVPVPGSSGSGYTEITVNPSPGKSVGVGQKVPVPVDLGANTSVDPVTQEISNAFKTVQQEASIFLKKKFAEMAAKAKTPAEKEKWDIDPDNTYMVTYDYNTTGERPYPAKIIKRISLTEALIANEQDTPKGMGYPITFYPGGPEVIVKPELKTHTPGTFDFGSRINPYTEKADTTHTYQGIYRESPEESAPVYNGANQSALTPDEFKKMIWKADYKKPYDQFLNEFWSHHEKNYPVMAKASLIKAAKTQLQEHSISKDAHDLIMRATGLSGEEASWPDLKLEDLQKNPPKDPNIEIGMLKVGNFQSTDLMYITDNKVRFDANGKKLPPLTVLHITGNSSPIHPFNGQAEMKTWFAKQMADPVKREAMLPHFQLKDKPNGYAQAGTVETLTGLGTWPEKRETPGGFLSYDHRAFSGYWDPQSFIKTEPSHSPFDEVTKRQKDRSYSDADVDITSDRDVTKNNIISGLEKAAKAAMFLTPLAFVMPEVALALDAFYLASGATTAGVGIDDKIHGKPTGNQRIIFGAFNAATVVLPHIANAGKAEERTANEIESSTAQPGKAPAPPHSPPDPAPPVEAGESTVNRLRPSQSKDISSYTVTDGEQLVSGVTPNSKGIYQIKGPNGEDRWLIRLTDDAGTSQIHEIDGRFKLSDGYAQIIDPLTKKPVMTVHATTDGRWEPINGPGGIKLPWNSSAASRAKKELDQHIANINNPKEAYTETEREHFSQSLTDLMKDSKAEYSQALGEYTEAGSAEINSELRAQPDPTKYSEKLKNLLSDLGAQADYRGPAFRYSYVSADGANKLKAGVGKVFREPAIQSSSSQPLNVKGWDTWAKDNPLTKNNQPVIYVFNESIPKKNLSRVFLVDHVAIKPNVSLEVLATKEKDGILYVYFDAPTKIPKERYNLFDGNVARPF